MMDIKVKLIALALIATFAWAVVQTGGEQTDEETVGTRGTRSHRPSKKAIARQIEIVDETSEYRLVKHPLGTTRVPLAPQRIACLSSAATDSLVALGLQPMMIESPTRDNGPPTYMTGRLRSASRVRGGEVLSLEAVSAARPDLIFMGSSEKGRFYEQFSKIAPTVSIASTVRGDRECRILDVGEVLGMSEKASERLAEHYRRIARARKILAKTAKNQPVAFLRFRRSTCVIYTQTAMFGPLLFEQLRLTPDPAMPIGGASRGWDILSLERLSSLRAEYIFMVVAKDSELYLDSISRTPVWRDIPAVKHNHVCRVDSGTWIGGDGLLGSEAIVKDVLAAMAPGEHW